jgi:hypothetical protein
MVQTTFTPIGRKVSEWRILLFLVLVTLLLHGHGLTFGFFLDDHNHIEHCRRDGYAGLATGNTFDWNRNIARVWWACEETGWAYFRPLPVALRTTWLNLFGLNPLPWHIIHLALYMGVVVLLYAVPRRIGFDQRTALIASLFFTLHPAHAQVSLWLASDCSILSLLGSLIALWFWHRSLEVEHRSPGILAGVFLTYALTMFSRENGIMLGPMLVLYDALAGNKPLRRLPWGLYLALAALAFAYLGLRSPMLPPAPLPRSPYMHWPTEPGFITWLPYKLLNNALSVTLGLPFTPIAEVPWMAVRPLTTLLAVLAMVGVVWLFLVPLRRSRAAWGVLAATILAGSPTVLCFSSAYNYYTISAGWAVLVALWAHHLWPVRPRLVGGTLVGLGAAYLVSLWAGSWQMVASSYADRCVRQEVLETHPEQYPPNTSLFFINLPLFSIETGPALRLATDRPDLQVFPLTLAPEPFCPRHRVVLKQEGDRTLLVELDGDGWFSGIVGEQVELAWFGQSLSHLPAGPVNVHPAAGKLPFTVAVVRRGDQGISSLRFHFEKPLTDPGYRFFVGNQYHYAVPLFRPKTESAPSYAPAFQKMSGRLQRMQMAFDFVVRTLQWCP